MRRSIEPGRVEVLNVHKFQRHLRSLGRVEPTRHRQAHHLSAFDDAADPRGFDERGLRSGEQTRHPELDQDLLGSPVPFINCVLDRLSCQHRCRMHPGRLYGVREGFSGSAAHRVASLKNPIRPGPHLARQEFRKHVNVSERAFMSFVSHCHTVNTDQPSS